jgi:hypothetical protein
VRGECPWGGAWEGGGRGGIALLGERGHAAAQHHLGLYPIVTSQYSSTTL